MAGSPVGGAVSAAPAAFETESSVRLNRPMIERMGHSSKGMNSRRCQKASCAVGGGKDKRSSMLLVMTVRVAPHGPRGCPPSPPNSAVFVIRAVRGGEGEKVEDRRT